MNVNQVGLAAAETIGGKHKFEHVAVSYGVQIEAYKGDNGVFKSADYRADVRRYKQSIKYSGVGVHHQNGISERAIRIVTESERSMLLHSAIHWPSETKTDLWPLAFDYACYIYNRLPKKNGGRSPIEIFSGVVQDKSWTKRARVFGCPSYMMDPKLQDAHKLPRLQPKSRQGQFLGKSSRHTSDIGLIRNLRTGLISTQFHVIYDDFYTTVPSTGTEDSIPETWELLYKHYYKNAVNDDNRYEVPTLNDEWFQQNEIISNKINEPRISSHVRKYDKIGEQRESVPIQDSTQKEVSFNLKDTDEGDDDVVYTPTPSPPVEPAPTSPPP